MIGLFSRTVKLTLGGTEYQFFSPRDFEFAVAGRTGMPASKIGALVELTDEELLREAEGIRKLEQRFSDILSAAIETDSPVGPVLEALDLSLVSQDNEWRSIIGALNSMGEGHEEYKRVALVKYMQYLTARQGVIRTLYSHRQRNRAEGSTQLESGTNAAMKETIIFDLSESSPDEGTDSNFGRLPKGETLELTLDPGEAVPVVLVKHYCKLVHDNALAFVDDTGIRTELKEGQNTVGRDDGCEVTLHPDYRDISRRHLVIERVSETEVKLTDLSSLGTFVPNEHLERTVI